MNHQPTVHIWAKLIAQHPNQANIDFPCNSHELNQYTKDSQWKIFQTQDNQTWIVNLSSVSYILVNNDTRLEEYEKKLLTGGEMITFNQKEKALHHGPSDYIFSFASLPSDNKLKRTRAESFKEVLANPISKSCKNDLEDYLKCALCYEVIYKCVTFQHCQHTFCSACLSDYLKNSSNTTTCPLCREKISSVTKNSFLQNLIEKLVIKDPHLQRSPEEYASRDEKDLISRGYNVIRENDGVYLGYCLNGQKEGEGKLFYSNGDLFTGFWRNNKREGEGIFTLENGDVIEGKWTDDVMGLNGKIKFFNKDIYEGEIKDLKGNGKGILTMPAGRKYEGEFVNDLLCGMGKYSWARGDEYEGHWENSMQNGFGIMKFANGDIYKGNWENDKKEGEGVLIYKDGKKYEGEWANNHFNGQGKLTEANGDVYEGIFANGSKTRSGIMNYRNGNIYEGEWRENKKHGQGTLTLQNGIKYKGKWSKDSLGDQVTIEYPDGDVYKGKIDKRTFEKDGKGILTLKSGEIYEGFFTQGSRNGEGTMKSLNGRKFVGLWRNNERHGDGTIFFGEESTCKGNWIDGVLQSQVRIKYDNGDVYLGEVDNESSLKRNGKGTLIYANKEMYIGDWEGDKKHGYGGMDFADGTEYKGKWKDDEKEEVEQSASRPRGKSSKR